MRYQHVVTIVCDACGSRGTGVREVLITPSGEMAFVAHPEGWQAYVVSPPRPIIFGADGAPQGGPVDLVALVRGGAEQAAATLKTQVQALICKPCVRRAETSRVPVPEGAS